MSEYKESKKAGDVGELEILKRLKRKYPLAYIDNRGKANSDWDIFVPEIGNGIEVKMDYKSFETGNIVIEVEFNDKLSALTLTKAKYWVIITGHEYIWITPLEIYRFLEQHIEYGRAKFTGDGDNKEKVAHLPAKRKLIKYVEGLDKECGWIEEIKKTDILYFDNFINLDIEAYLKENK